MNRASSRGQTLSQAMSTTRRILLSTQARLRRERAATERQPQCAAALRTPEPFGSGTDSASSVVAYSGADGDGVLNMTVTARVMRCGDITNLAREVRSRADVVGIADPAERPHSQISGDEEYPRVADLPPPMNRKQRRSAAAKYRRQRR